MKNQQEIATPALCNIADSEIDREKSCKNAQKKTLSPTRRLTYMAAMTAISLLLKLVSNALSVLMPPTMKISLSYLGWYASAAVVGPLGGGIVAAEAVRCFENIFELTVVVLKAHEHIHQNGLMPVRTQRAADLVAARERHIALHTQAAC